MIIKAVCHPVSLKKESDLKRRTWKSLEICCPIGACKGVGVATGSSQGGFHFFAGEIFGALKLHVLDPMAKTSFSRQFVAGTDVVPDPGADDRRGVDLF